MFVSETITVQASPRNQFRTIDHSQQQIQMPQLETIQLSKSAKVVPELRSRKVYLIKDKPRNKLVWVELRIFQYKQQDSIMPDDSKYCRICLCDDGSSELIKPCQCKGSLRYVHENCLKVWILEKQGIEKVYQNDIECEVCHTKFKMDMKFSVSRQYKMICRATQGRKCCWWLQGCCSLGILGTICFLIYEIAMGRFEALVLAGVTVLFVLLILCFSLTYVSCLDQVTIEVLDPWKFICPQQENDSFSEIELDNPNKQTIQNDDPQYQTINVVQIK